MSIENALERGEEILVEGRQRLRDLRLGVEVSSALVNRIREFAEQCALDYPAKFGVSSNDGDQIIEPVVGEEAFLIAREALLNAFKHAHANDIRVKVDHGMKGLSICVQDNGQGFKADAKHSSQIANRWGVVGMHERASSIGAELTIKSVEGQGTEVSLWIPAQVAYNGKR
ncbi:hypothetical protein DWU98_13055 [Dyella monticola]|uniref:Histidine kinase/HSP90-like ATPase domain-containing protein n=1 Tax=Dyella monticola TaxID=1927958 RepID=A0A370WXZ5_9GAMM|nr:hypothetical protein DWU98_13055 [Dyella monticola]